MNLLLGVSDKVHLSKQRKLVETIRNEFLANPLECIPTRSVVYNSWMRCRKAGIDPSLKRSDTSFNDRDLKHTIKQATVYDFALPTLQELSMHMQQTHSIITLSDNQGKIIFLEGDRHVQRLAEKINFVLGSNWSEEIIGTNAIGTALQTSLPVQVFSAEHYCEGIHDWVCSSSPIRNPITKEVLGVLNVTGPWKEAHPHTLGIVMMAAQVIESRYYEDEILLREQLYNHYSALNNRYPQKGIIVLDDVTQLVKANRAAHNFFQQQFGKDIKSFWTDQTLLTKFRNGIQTIQESESKVYSEQFGLSMLMKEIYQNDKRIGFILTFELPVSKNSTTQSKGHLSWGEIVGNSGGIVAAVSDCKMAAKANVPVLILGESGSGKELFARAIHHSSSRQECPFLAVNCGAIPKELLASELFGYTSGTFTGANKSGKKGKFEEANSGTLFLDEIGEMPLEAQIYLLRVIQEQEVVRLGGSKPIPLNVRIIAATHRNLEKLVQQGLFRLDLYYRLNVVSVSIPALRYRRDDIPLLINHFLVRFGQKYAKTMLVLDKEVTDFLTNVYQWPGNIRELENTLEHAVLFCQSDIITLKDLPSGMQITLGHSYQTMTGSLPVTNSMETISSDKREELLKLLQEADGNLSAAARRLGVARTTLYRQLNKCGISTMRDFLRYSVYPH